ncbi:hypothetical protein ACHAXT_010762 [Thalassiosira profunda]
MAPLDDSRASLERRLAALLGISIDDDRDYAVDVLEALLEIGNVEDAVEYLSGFVAGDGSDGEDLLGFARDLERFKRGEEIDTAPTQNAKDEAEVSLETKPKAKAVLDEAAAHREEIRRREAAAKEREREEQDRLAKMKAEEDEQRQIREEAAATLAEKKMAEQFSVKKAAANPQDVVSKMQTSALKGASAKQPHNQSKGKQKQKQKSLGETTKKAEPNPRAKKQNDKAKKGKSKQKECGCFGNKHKPLTNCLHCGRIACEGEGIDDYCHFCGFYIEDFSTKTDGNAKIASALRHKERLLQFDRESVKRTHIHDDQEDYFAVSNSMWATSDEQEDARQLEEERRKKIHERGNQVMSINF